MQDVFFLGQKASLLTSMILYKTPQYPIHTVRSNSSTNSVFLFTHNHREAIVIDYYCMLFTCPIVYVSYNIM